MNKVRQKYFDQVVVLTRPAGVNDEFARYLSNSFPDIKLLKIPLSQFAPTHNPLPPLANFDAILITSRAVTRFVEAEFLRLPIYAVGEQTVKALTHKGLEVAQGFARAQDLADALHQLPAKNFLYLRGEDISLDLSQFLQNTQKKLSEVVIYRLEDKSTSKESIEALQQVDSPIFPVFSQKSYLRLADWLENINYQENFEVIAISDDLARFVRKDRQKRQFDKNLTQICESKAPTRNEMVVAIGEIYLGNSKSQI